ncbi:fungal-specific transcription factor domain-containing protein [Phycomyces nitens]|nr:fungal-specific transcription factor domain-containing protein [Phycomyces nitens]
MTDPTTDTRQSPEAPEESYAAVSPPSLHDNIDTLFASPGSQSPLSNSNQTGDTKPASRPDKMMEQLTDGLVQLTLHRDTSNFQNEITPWRTYGEFVHWSPDPTLPGQYLSSIDMPPRHTQEHLISVFFSHCHHLLPTLSRRMFYDQLSIKGPLITPLLLNIMYAHAAKNVDLTITQAEMFYHRARRLVDDFMDVPRLSTVIALLYMAWFDYDSTQQRQTRPRSSRSWMYCGMAVRMCLELGLHTANYSSQMSQFDIELRKRVLWTCYVMDKFESCTMERPWMLNVVDIAVDLPTPLPEDDSRERTVMEGFGQLCRLTMLLEKILYYFTYDAKNSQTIWTIHQENQTLQFLDALQRWRDSLPPELAWSVPDGIPSLVTANLHLVCLDLELSLLVCCRFQEEQLHRERRRSLANAITQLVSYTVQHPHLMYTCALSTFSAVFAALTHATDFNHPMLSVAEEAKNQFRASLGDLRDIAERAPLKDVRGFARLVDLTLQPQTPLHPLPRLAILSPSYSAAFSAIHDLCQKHEENQGINLNLFDHDQQAAAVAAVLDTSTAFSPSSSGVYCPPVSIGSRQTTPPYSNPQGHALVAPTFAYNPCLPSNVGHPTSAGAAAAAAAAAAAVGAVGAPITTSGMTNKEIEPADYTFELISVADEWARSLIY